MQIVSEMIILYCIFFFIYTDKIFAQTYVERSSSLYCLCLWQEDTSIQSFAKTAKVLPCVKSCGFSLCSALATYSCGGDQLFSVTDPLVDS